MITVTNLFSANIFSQCDSQRVNKVIIRVIPCRQLPIMRRVRERLVHNVALRSDSRDSELPGSFTNITRVLIGSIYGSVPVCIALVCSRGTRLVRGRLEDLFAQRFCYRSRFCRTTLRWENFFSFRDLYGIGTPFLRNSQLLPRLLECVNW